MCHIALCRIQTKAEKITLPGFWGPKWPACVCLHKTYQCIDVILHHNFVKLVQSAVKQAQKCWKRLQMWIFSYWTFPCILPDLLNMEEKDVYGGDHWTLIENNHSLNRSHNQNHSWIFPPKCEAVQMPGKIKLKSVPVTFITLSVLTASFPNWRMSAQVPNLLLECLDMYIGPEIHTGVPSINKADYTFCLQELGMIYEQQCGRNSKSIWLMLRFSLHNGSQRSVPLKVKATLYRRH